MSQDQSQAIQRRYDPERRVVALTGASSFIGTHLIARFERDARYARVIATDIRPPEPVAGTLQTKTTFCRVDLTQPTADVQLTRLASEHEVDTVVHLAFLTNPTRNAAWAHELEVAGTSHVLNACSACRVAKVVVHSLTALYGARADNPNFLSEEAPLRPLGDNAYFTNKAEAERLVDRFRGEEPGTVVTVLRTAAMLGRDVGNYVSRYIARPMVPTLIGHDPLIQLLGAHDAVSAFKLVVDDDHPGHFNIAADGVLPLSTVIALAGRVALPLPRLALRALADSMWVTQLADAPASFIDLLRYICIADTAKANSELDFSAEQDITQVILSFAEHAGGRDRRAAKWRSHVP